MCIRDRQNETQVAQQMIEDNFTSKNMLALIVPTGDYDKESAILDELGQYDEVDSTMGLTNIEALDGYMLADKLTPRQFSELAGLDYEAAQVVYAAYAAQHSEYGKLAGNLATYKVPLIDMFLFVCDQVDSGIVTLSDDQTQMLQDAEVQMNSAKAQLQGTDYDRMLIYLTLPESSDETYAFTDKILEIAEKYYPDENVYLAGESTNEYEFEKSFAVDNKVVSINTTSKLAVVLVKPDRFEQAAEIADHLKDKRTVVLNLEQTNKDIARRLVDFLSGVAYANEGKIKKVANSTYITVSYTHLTLPTT